MGKGVWTPAFAGVERRRGRGGEKKRSGWREKRRGEGRKLGEEKKAGMEEREAIRFCTS
jgi:hypothetical protein